MKFTRLLFVLLFCSLLQACGTSGKAVSYDWNTSTDPLEGLNRSVYAFNDTADKLVLRPVASGYDKVLPAPAKKGVSNFFSNLNEPLSALNNVLQGKFDRALGSTYRFAVNSTVGLLGLIDVAKYQGVDRAPEDLGQTLATWGVKPGAYLMLPILGPTNVRDGFGDVVSRILFRPLGEITDSGATELALTTTSAISDRAGLLGVDSVLDNQLDPYLFIKTTVENSRTDAINDGNGNLEDEFNF